MGEQRFTVTVVEAGHGPASTHTDYMYAAVLRFCRAMTRSQHKDCVITLTEHDGTERTVAVATFGTVTPSNPREESNG